MRKLPWTFWTSLAIVAAGCKQTARNHPDAAVPPADTITVSPVDAVLYLTANGPPMQAFTVTAHGTAGDMDVTASAKFSLANAAIGDMKDNTFTASTGQSGSSPLYVKYTPHGGFELSAAATVSVRHLAVVANQCQGCVAFPDPGAPACPANTAATVVYPPDSVLLPPNLNQLSVQFTPGAGARLLWQVVFQNAVSELRIPTRCTPTVDINGMDSGGCEVVLDQAAWESIARWNKGGDPVNVSVLTSTDGACLTPSTNSPAISFAEEDLIGVVYYWKSTVGNVTGGEIWRKSFGDKKPEEQITGVGQPDTCFGCHALSRDGKRMTVNSDDNDSDDEYGDVASGLWDLVLGKFINPVSYACGESPGFQTFNQDHSYYLGSVGNNSGMTGSDSGLGCSPVQPIDNNDFILWHGNDATLATKYNIPAGPTGTRPTHPDWSVDDKNVVYVLPTKVGGMAAWSSDDTHVFGGSLWRLPYLGAGRFGNPVPLLKSRGENNYYPSYSPDGNFVLFNRVPLTGTVDTIDQCTGHLCPNDSFSNPSARVFILPTAAGGLPIDCEALNGSPANNPSSYSNSWPRWSPFLQRYKGSELLWVAFSSTRDYGLRVRNHATVNGTAMFQCYPPGTPENQNGDQQYGPNCQQPQLWMAAINLTSAGELGGPHDPSFAAFWIPFQDITTHNHTAQWTTTIVTSPDGGACINMGEDCTHAPNDCCMGYVCLGDGKCGMPIP